MKHKDKVALITGAAQGLGFACAERLIADGAKVLFVDIQEDKVKEATAKFGDRAAGWICDLRQIDTSMADEIVAAAVDAFGKLDILIANAGIIHLDDFVDFPEAAFDEILTVNLKSAFLLGQSAARQMISQGHGGSIINMSSINAILANPRSVGYAVSKGGMKQLTAVMAVGLIEHGIRVNAIGPGTILTELNLRSVMATEEQRRMILSRTPARRLGDPSEVASVASFLASDDASYIVGQTIYPDGGRLILNYTVPVNE
ncbi:glucose 1-dehydrogenase (plasmid) [Rhizobium sp. 32-5/1]|uniref:SDR family NAD(P)-dependent oxidoreductase n=1 Tax=Rhizobium sp. 32-5/1 TaxID=3019602 RepID=UPI00240E8491|nr:glucose 1-dehydrogenase [Rhizobium sp. 32-5/1]WEZ85476.1 glucose 1-dehydrogenase [Rhizobium sp. 32-5/1]